jgi:very-short-patch-repair endonuclease
MKKFFTTEEFIGKSKLKHDNKYDYSLVEYKNLRSKVKIICPVHGVFEQKADAHKDGNGCFRCNDSKGEKEIALILEEMKIKYYREFSFKECSYKDILYFDFYLPELNILIEYDGEQHYKPIKYLGGEERYLEQKKKDEIKNNFCFKNNITLLRIKYNEDIREKLTFIKE